MKQSNKKDHSHVQAQDQVQLEAKLQEQGQTTEEGSEGSIETLDFENLDLTVEAVDERISPSETNVFDK